MGNFRADEKHGAGIRAGRGTSAAADARGGFHGEIGIGFRDRKGVAVRRGAGARGDETAGLLDAIEGACGSMIRSLKSGNAPRGTAR